MRKKATVKELYYFNLFSISLLGLIGVIAFVCISVYRFNLPDVDPFNNFLYAVMVFCFTSMVFFITKELIPLLKDYSNVKSSIYQIVCGSVIAFKKNRDPESGIQINSKPIVQPVGQSDTIMLKVNTSLKIGQTYIFIYLEHSKLAYVKEEILIS